MASDASSATETALENQRIGPLQLRVAALCTLIQICDGYDINSIAWAVPALKDVWHLAPPAFTTAFLWSSIGIMVGALSAGPIGDSLGMLTILRFFTGLGIGGAFPGAATLTGDYAPHRRRALMIMASFTGAPLGGFICGQLAGVLLPTLGWPSIFVVGGVIPLLMVPVFAVWLPESPRFLARKANLSAREAAL